MSADVNVSRAAFLHCHKLRAVHENWRAIESQTSTDARERAREPDIRGRERNATPRTVISVTTNLQQLHDLSPFFFAHSVVAENLRTEWADFLFSVIHEILLKEISTLRFQSFVFSVITTIL